MLGRLFTLQEIAIHTPDELDWDNAPSRCVVQLHWWRREPFVSQLRRNGFEVVALARHPLDVMISTLNYTYYSHDWEHCAVENCWCCLICEAAPRSAEFRKYVEQWPGQNTLSYSPTWWHEPGVHRVRYEDLVEDTVGTLGSLADSLGWTLSRSLEEAARDYDKERLRAFQDTWHYHYWQGRPGLWRSLLPATEADPLFSAHKEVFETLGYADDYNPDPSLDGVTADLNWFRLQHQATRKHLRDERVKHDVTRIHLDDARSRLSSAQNEISILRVRLEASLGKLESVAGLGPRSIGFARGLQRVSATIRECSRNGPSRLRLGRRLKHAE
jgi:hypothetical protein